LVRSVSAGTVAFANPRGPTLAKPRKLSAAIEVRCIVGARTDEIGIAVDGGLGGPGGKIGYNRVTGDGTSW
jgi:hypothetical protein